MRFRWPKIPLGLRFFIVYFILVLMTAYLVSSTLIKEIKPAIRQATEETLVDMANLLAVMASHEVDQNGQLSENFSNRLLEFGKRQPQADIWGVNKKSVNHRIYITNVTGIVIADSWQQDIGADFSKWNDVYLTLRGQYGARSTALDKNDPLSTVMHVAAPIYKDQTIIGSVTVAKANRSVQPFIEQSKKRVINWLVLISLFALSLGALFAWRINAAVNKLTVFAEKTGAGERLIKPSFRVFYEYRKLSQALESMRDKLDGKQYVEDYVQTLTHELKSPLSAIKGASEILQLPVTEQKRALFAKNIEQESSRMQQLIDQLLELAKLEKQPDINFQLVNVKTLVETTLNACLVNTSDKELHIDNQITADLTIKGDPFLLRQGLINLLDNACDFTTPKHTIRLSIEHTSEAIKLSVFNQGAAIPDYALDRVTQRFYSLPRSNGQKSTGLGLSFVEQIMQLHKGRFDIKNAEHGVCATLTFYAS